MPSIRCRELCRPWAALTQLVIAFFILLAAQSIPPVQQPAAATPQKASEKDSLRAQRLAWAPLHFMKRRPAERHLMEKARARVRAAYYQWQPVIPGDDWLAGLRISFPMPGGAASPVYRGLPDCRATTWWCELLNTFLLWQNRRPDEAHVTLDKAFASMPPQTRCIWADVSMLISDTRERAEYEMMPCLARAEIEEKLWWLADPLWSVAGNERMVDHFARAVNLRLATELIIPDVDGYPYALSRTRRATHKFTGTDLAPESLNPPAAADSAQRAEFNGPEGLLQRAFKSMRDADYRRANFMLMENALRHRIVRGAIPSLPSTPHQFVPAFAAIQFPFRSQAGDWNLQAVRRLESGASLVGPIVPIEAQHAFFLRGDPARPGDSARLVVVSEPERNSFLAGSLMHATLVTSTSPGAEPVMFRMGSSRRYEFSPMVAYDSMLVSLEVIANMRGAGRVRFGVVPPPKFPGRLRLSDVLLLRSAGETAPPAGGLDDVLPRALPTTQLPRGARVGLFWEVYGLRPGEQPEFTVSVTRAPPGSGATGASANATAQTQSSSIVRWTEAPSQGRAIEPAQLLLDLSRVEPGTYYLALSAAVPGEPPVTVIRRVIVGR